MKFGHRFIKNERLFKATTFVRKLMSESVPVALAIYKSAKYYKINQHLLASTMGKIASDFKEIKKK